MFRVRIPRGRKESFRYRIPWRRWILLSALSCLISLHVASHAGADPGDLDPGFAGFGNGGQLVLEGRFSPGGAVEQPDGKIVVVGYSSGIYVMRLRANGEPDPEFDGDGLATPDVPGGASCVTVQADGKIVLAGGTPQGDFKLARLNPDGSLDTSFGQGGWLTVDFDGDIDVAEAVIVQPDGRIVAAGWAGVSGDDDFAAVRCLPNGALDTSFSGDGKVAIGFGGSDSCYDIALQEDGKLVLAGDSLAGFPVSDWDFAVARLHVNGTLDGGFDGDGKVKTGFFGDEGARCVAIQSDGRIVVAGRTTFGDDEGKIARYMPNGSLDSSFDGDGKLSNDNNSCMDVAVQPDGKIVLLGTHVSPDGDPKFAFHRHDLNGSLDTTFGGGDGNVDLDFGGNDTGLELALLPDGRMLGFGSASGEMALVRLWPDGTFDSGGQQALGFRSRTFPPGSDEYVYGMAVQPDGKIVVAGTVANALNTESDFALARFLPNGLLDGSFGVGGRVEHSLQNVDVARAVAIQPDGKIVVAGYTGSSNPQFFVVRFHGNGERDTTFGFAGLMTIDFFGAADYCHAVAVAPDGKFVLAGTVFSGFNPLFGVVRLTADGFLDETFDGDGKRTFAFPGATGHWANGLVVQPDRKIVVGGQANGDFALVRFLENGALDGGFGAGGIGYTITDMGGTDAIRALALETAGAFAGYIFAAGGGRATQDFALARYGPDGTLAGCPTRDCSTGWPGGKAFADWGGSETAWAVDLRDGKVVAAGCVNGLLGWVQLLESTPASPLQSTTDFVGQIECESGGEFFTLGGAGVQFHFGAQLVVAATQNVAGDRNFALAGFETIGSIGYVSDRDEQVETPRSGWLQPIFPNPLVHQSVIAFDLPRAQAARVRVYDVAGRLVRTLAAGDFAPGRHRSMWDGTDDGGNPVARGVYFVRLDAGAVGGRRSVTVLR